MIKKKKVTKKKPKTINDDELPIRLDLGLEQRLERREKLKEVAKEYEDLDKDIKNDLKGRSESFKVGKFKVTGKLISKPAYSVDSSEYWSTKIKKIEE